VGHTNVTVHLSNEDKNLRGSEAISNRVQQVHRILNGCDPRPSRIAEHIYDGILTEVEVEYHLEGSSVDDVHMKIKDLLKCNEQSLREFSFIVDDIE
jgi:hypothetical protein